MLKYFVFIALIVVSVRGISQDFSAYSKKVTKQFEQARQLYNNRDYSSALEIVNSLIDKNQNFLEACLLKADVIA